jgi:hypothetical protein
MTRAEAPQRTTPPTVRLVALPRHDALKPEFERGREQLVRSSKASEKRSRSSSAPPARYGCVCRSGIKLISAALRIRRTATDRMV